LGLDPVPIYMLAAVIAWFSLVCVEFYERTFRGKIEKNRDLIWGYVQSEKQKIKDDIEIPMRSDSRNLSAKLEDLSKLVERPDDFIKWRKWLTILLVTFGGIAGYVAYRPVDTICLLPNLEWLVIAFFAVILANGVFIHEVFKVDERITKLIREKERLRFI